MLNPHCLLCLVFFQLLFAVHSPSTFENILSKTSYTPLNSLHPNSTMYLADICVSIGKGIHPPSLPGMKRCLISKSDKRKRGKIYLFKMIKKQEIVEDNPPDASSPIPSVVVRGASKSSRAVGLLGEVHL